ncbi:MAG: flippase [Calditrichaeota bacterium]|nr:flippase [Calditrichota bacterium]MCB9067832.1 flippase [Calditrichia bacterium]
MSANKTIARNTLVLNAGHVIAKLINLALILIMTQMLGDDGYGFYNFGFSFVMLFMIFTQFGMSTYLVRHISQNKSTAEKVFGTTFPLVIVFSVITLLLVNGIAGLTNWTDFERSIIFLFSFFLFFDGISRFSYAIFRSFERMEFEALTYISERFLMLIAALILWQTGASLLPLIAVFAAVECLKALLALGFIHRTFFRIRLKWDRELARFILKESWPFAMITAFGAIMVNIDSVMLKIFHTADIVGIYAAGRRLIESLTFLPETFVVALFPAFSALFVQNRNLFQQNMQRAFQYMLAIAVPIGVVLFMLADEIVVFLFADEFAGSAVALQWLAIWLSLLFLKQVLVVSLNATGHQRLVSALIGLAMLLNVMLNYLLIPQFVIIGACVATIAAESVTVVGALIMLKKHFQLDIFSVTNAKILLAGALLWVIVYYLQNVPVVVAGILSIAGYVLLIYFLQIVDKKELDFLKNMSKRQK